MKYVSSLLPRAALLLLVFTILCGGLYTAAVTGIAQLLFPNQANGSIIQIDGRIFGSELIGQQFNDLSHMWGRIMYVNTDVFTDSNGNKLMYSSPSNLSPASPEFDKLIAQRVSMIKAANLDSHSKPIPVDLVTSSGSGLDPHISLDAALFQVPRLASANNMTENDIIAIIHNCTKGKFLGIFGEITVNVLKVNLMIDGLLEYAAF